MKMKPRLKSPQSICEICNRSFSSLHNYSQHIKAHARKEEISTTCQFCQKSFKALKDHIRSQHMEKQFLCGFEGCDKGFSRKHGLQRHLLTHSDHFKQIECPICHRLFVEKIQLERHYQVHLKEEKKTSHQCEKCFKYFNRHADLLRHVNSVHSEKVFQCDFCPDRRFGSKFEVLRHFKTVHMGVKYKRRKVAPRIKLQEIFNSNEDQIEMLEDIEIIDENPSTVSFVTIIPQEFEIIQEELKQPKEINWECQRCNRFFESLARLKLHNSRNHNWKCKKCLNGKDVMNFFHRKEDFEVHWMDNHGSLSDFPYKLECSYCFDMFGDKAALHTHHRHEHGVTRDKIKS